jgi:hypothetical protein
VRLLEDGSVIEAGVNAVGSVLLGALAAFASYSMASIAG